MHRRTLTGVAQRTQKGEAQPRTKNERADKKRSVETTTTGGGGEQVEDGRPPIDIMPKICPVSQDGDRLKGRTHPPAHPWHQTTPRHQCNTHLHYPQTPRLATPPARVASEVATFHASTGAREISKTT